MGKRETDFASVVGFPPYLVRFVECGYMQQFFTALVTLARAVTRWKRYETGRLQHEVVTQQFTATDLHSADPFSIRGVTTIAVETYVLNFSLVKMILSMATVKVVWTPDDGWDAELQAAVMHVRGGRTVVTKKVRH